MSPFKKSDVKNHLSTHDRYGKRLHRISSTVEATGFSGNQSSSTDSSRAIHESLQQPDLLPIVVPVVSKSARA